MRIFDWARRPPQWLRVTLAGLLLAFALNSVAHVTHRHDATPASVTHSISCGYCVSFNGLADAPRHSHAAPVEQQFGVFVAPEFDLESSSVPETSARPRAPPLF